MQGHWCGSFHEVTAAHQVTRVLTVPLKRQPHSSATIVSPSPTPVLRLFRPAPQSSTAATGTHAAGTPPSCHNNQLKTRRLPDKQLFEFYACWARPATRAPSPPDVIISQLSPGDNTAHQRSIYMLHDDLGSVGGLDRHPSTRKTVPACARLSPTHRGGQVSRARCAAYPAAHLRWCAAASAGALAAAPGMVLRSTAHPCER